MAVRRSAHAWNSGARLASPGSEANAPGVGRRLPRRLHDAAEPPESVGDVEAFEAHGVQRQVERGQLVRIEAGIAEVVAVTVDAVALERRVDARDRLEEQRDAHVAQVFLVALERASEGGLALGVAGDPRPQLVGGEGPGGLEQGADEVEEPFELVQRSDRHSEAMSFSTRSSRDLNGSLHSTVRWAWSLSFRCTQSTV